MRDIPGPPAQPDGGLSAIAAAGGLHTYQLDLHERYGPLVRFQLPGAETAISVADPVLLEATAGIDKRPDKLFEFLAPLCEAGNLQTLPADEHGPFRRALLSVLAGRPSHEAHFAGFTALATDLADRWARRAAEGPVALQQDLSELSLRMICQYALGGGIDDPARVVSAFETVLTVYLGRLYERDDELTRAEEALAYLREVVNGVLERSGDGHGAGAPERGGGGREDGVPERGGDGHGDGVLERGGDGGPEGRGSELVAALVKAGMSPARIRDSVLMIMLAAHHTTGVAVSWTLHLLSRHPAHAARVTEELDAVLDGRPAPEYADLRRLPQLEMALKESMRLYPPGPYGARETTEALTLGDHHIPAGTTIFYPFWAVHLNPAYWPDPRTFDPGRFTPEAQARRPRFAYVPFGLGPRSCEGASLAMVEAELVLAVLLARFRFEPVPGHPVTPVERFVLWAEHDLRMHLTDRRPA
ncbi:cytochrome P450 [Nonomuraea candida]|uniref:cytochrome P450 n=1 Tax=Nonomuraea candida TaxID=359159 RepID=UPI0005BE48FB|nr:cytochrome P450 [Nonomuraea candida]